jgi:hypothetical protein
LGSARFRMLIAVVVVGVVGVLLAMLLLARAGSPTGQFGIDATDYLTAAERISVGSSPYATEMLVGPVDAQGTDRYRYPPTFAQLLVPLTALDHGAALWLLLVLQLVAIAAAVGLALRMAGLLRPEPVLWAAAATVLFLPVFDSLWKGNVSGFLSLLVVLAVMGGATGGSAVAIAALLKVAPITFVPAWLAVDGRSRRGMALTVLGVVALSALLAPTAWRDYLSVLPNLVTGAADEATNVAPWSVVARSGVPEVFGSVVRVISLVAAVAAIAASVVVIRRPGGLPTAATLATMAMLLLPAALWYHYLVVLLPLAILAWPSATHSERVALVVAGALVTGGVAWLPLATIGATGLLLITLRAQARRLGDEV